MVGRAGRGRVVKFVVDADKCVGAGACVLAAPEVFDQNDDGIVMVIDENGGALQKDAVLDAAVRCPAAVIRVLKR